MCIRDRPGADRTDALGLDEGAEAGNEQRHAHSLVEDIRSSGVSLDSLQQDVQSIVSVLDVIRPIAEQTNLLALNVAIEAARGFAVVADEHADRQRR